MARKKHPVVILHGWKLNAKKYIGLKEKLAKQRYKVYIPEMPGHGVERGPKKSLTLDDYVDFIKRFLSQENIKEPIVIGHSFGGRVGIKLAAENPTLVKQLILTGVPGFRSESLLRITVLKILAKSGKVLFKRNHLMRTLLYRLAGTTDYIRSKGVMEGTFINIINEDLIELMRKIACPVLLVWGGKDQIVPVKIAKKMQKVIPDSELIIVENYGHDLPYSKPKVFIEKSSL